MTSSALNIVGGSSGLITRLLVDVSTVSLVPHFGHVFIEKEDVSLIFVDRVHTGQVTFSFMVCLLAMLR
jgi:hypothetical protein